MTRTAVPYSAPDLSALARLLERALADHQITHGRLPGHVEMMNLLARGAGKRNLQECQAGDRPRRARRGRRAAPSVPDMWFDAPELLDPTTTPALAPPAPSSPNAPPRTLKCFDFSGRLVRWPLKLSQQRLAMWVLWTRFDAPPRLHRGEVNRVLKAWHTYGDHATLRRELINHQLMTRKSDCSEYRKLRAVARRRGAGLLRALRSPGARRAGARAPAARAAVAVQPAA